MNDGPVTNDRAPLTRIVDGRIVPVAGTWTIDSGHTHTGFGVRHLLTLMRGRFREQEGTIVIAEDPTESRVEVVIQAASLDTTHPKADETVRGDRYLDTEQFPTITFVSTSVRPTEGARWEIDGDLTIRDVTRSARLQAEFLGAVYHPFGATPKMSFAASTSINRSDFGVGGVFELPDARGVMVVGDRIELTLDIEADLSV